MRLHSSPSRFWAKKAFYRVRQSRSSAQSVLTGSQFFPKFQANNPNSGTLKRWSRVDRTEPRGGHVVHAKHVCSTTDYHPLFRGLSEQGILQGTEAPHLECEKFCCFWFPHSPLQVCVCVCSYKKAHWRSRVFLLFFQPVLETPVPALAPLRETG